MYECLRRHLLSSKDAWKEVKKKGVSGNGTPHIAGRCRAVGVVSGDDERTQVSTSQNDTGMFANDDTHHKEAQDQYDGDAGAPGDGTAGILCRLEGAWVRRTRTTNAQQPPAKENAGGNN
jgi:hypothetical protein